MYLVLIAWLYVAVMMAVAEATHSTGTVLGALITFVLYGLLPMSVVLYLMGAPARRKAIKKREAEERARHQATPAADPVPPPVSPPCSDPPDAGCKTATGAEQPAVAPVREEKT